MIRVRVFPLPFCNFDNLDERGWLELNDDAQLLEVLRKIKMPKTLVKLFAPSVNGEKAPLTTVLKNGDVVGFFWLLTGG